MPTMSHFSALRRQPASLVILITLLSLVLVSGFCLAAVTFFTTASNHDFFSRKFCFSNRCVTSFLSVSDQTFVLFSGTMELVVAMATTGGIVVALLSYLNTSHNTALTNHIEHLKIFQEYLVSELGRRTRVSPKSIDTLRLYGMIFTMSRHGRTDVSGEYVGYISALNSLIEQSNLEACSTGFRYKTHQVRMRDHWALAGITVHLAPRNEFFETEGELIQFMESLNQSFCQPHSVPNICQRKYN